MSEKDPKDGEKFLGGSGRVWVSASLVAALGYAIIHTFAWVAPLVISEVSMRKVNADQIARMESRLSDLEKATAAWNSSRTRWRCSDQELFIANFQRLNPRMEIPSMPRACDP